MYIHMYLCDELCGVSSCVWAERASGKIVQKGQKGAVLSVRWCVGGKLKHPSACTAHSKPLWSLYEYNYIRS